MSDTEIKEAEDQFVEEEPTEGAVPGHEQELDQYGENVQKRINEAVEAQRRAEREAESLRVELAKTTDLAKRAVGEVNNLRQRVNEGDEAILDSLVGRLKEEANTARNAFVQAQNDGDAEKIATAAMNLSTATSDLRRAEVAKAGYRPAVQHEPKPDAASPAQPPRQAPNLPEETKKWLEANKDWYMKDAIKTNIARAADAAVARKGIDPNSSAYYKELDTIMNRALEGMTPGGQPRDPRQPAQATAPMGRSAAPTGGGARKVPLSASEQGIARKLGLTNEQYAAEKAKL